MSCVFEDCTSDGRKNRMSKEPSALSFHRFPRNEELKREWIRRVNRPDWVWHKFSKVCSRHFEDYAFEPNEIVKWRRLKINALPTLHLPETDPLPNRPAHAIKITSRNLAASTIQPVEFQDSFDDFLESAPTMVNNAIKVEHSYSICPEPINNAVTQDLAILPIIPVEEASDAESTTDTQVDIKVELESLADASLEDDTSLEPINKSESSTTNLKKKKDRNSIKRIGKTNILTEQQFFCIKQKPGPECPIHEGIISKLQKELDRTKKISQQRLRKINALTKSLSRQKKKTDLLYDKLLEKVTEEEMEAEY